MPHHEDLLKIGQEWKAIKEENILDNEIILGNQSAFQLRRFTMDDHFERAVRMAFFRLFQNDHLYRIYDIGFYCPKLRTLLRGVFAF